MAEPLSATIPVVRSEPRTRRALWLEAIALRHQIAVLERSRTGEPLYVQDAVKGTRHYRYYVSRGLVRGSVQDDRRGWRVSAPELERAVRAATQQMLGDRAAIAGAIEELNIDAHRLPSIFKVAEAWIQSLLSEAEAASALTRLIQRVGLKNDGIQISIKLPISSDEGRDVATPNEPALSRFVPMRMKRRGVEMRLIIDGDAASLARIDLPLLDATARAYRWYNDLLAGRARSIGEIAGREHLTALHVRRVLRLAFLAPRIVEAILEGCRTVRRWTCQNRQQRILSDFHAQPLPLAFSASTAARESRPTRRFHRFSIM
jgi:site-specific DNA recombinase